MRERVSRSKEVRWTVDSSYRTRTECNQMWPEGCRKGRSQGKERGLLPAGLDVGLKKSVGSH